MLGFEMDFQLDPRGGNSRTQVTRQADGHVASFNVLDHVLAQLLPIGAVCTVPDPVAQVVATAEQLGLHRRVQV
jgi:hypothetical protein